MLWNKININVFNSTWCGQASVASISRAVDVTLASLDFAYQLRIQACMMFGLAADMTTVYVVPLQLNVFKWL